MNRTLLAFTAAALLLAPAAYASEITGTLTAGGGGSVTGTVIGIPVATPAPGTYGAPLSVTLTASGAYAIRYTTDGTAPNCTGGGLLYSTPIPITGNTTIMAISCYLSGASSSVGTYVYTINGGSLSGTVATSSAGNLTGTVVNSPSSGTLTGTVVSNGGGGGGGGGAPGNGPPVVGGGGSGSYPPLPGNGLGFVCPIQGSSYNTLLGRLPCLFTLGALFGGGGSGAGGPGVPNTGGPSSQSSPESAQNPGIPNTGAGGDAEANMLLLATSALVAASGTLFLRRRLTR